MNFAPELRRQHDLLDPNDVSVSAPVAMHAGENLHQKKLLAVVQPRFTRPARERLLMTNQFSLT